MRKSYSGAFKAKAVVEVIRERDTLAELSSKFQVHRVMLTRWKKEALEGLPKLFAKKSKKANNDKKLIESLYNQIGQLTVENNWLKKNIERINI